MTRICRIIATKPDRLILRDKHSTQTDYFLLAKKVTKYCDEFGVKLTLHNFTDHPAKSIHLPMPIFRSLSALEQKKYNEIGVSIHSVEEAMEAEKSGVSYITYGHIYPTACKPNIPPRGTASLRQIVRTVDVPVYAIGGINSQNIAEIRDSGASGACLMNSMMSCEDPEKYMAILRERIRKNEIQTGNA